MFCVDFQFIQKSCFSTMEPVRFEKQYAEILFDHTVVSKYSGEKSEGTMNRTDLFLKHNEKFDTLEQISSFEPVEYGYSVKSIKVQNELFLRTTKEESINKVYINNVLVDDSHKHRILLDVDELYGWEDNLWFGIGVLTECIAGCNPVFNWYCDNKLIKQAQNLFWILVPSTENHTWYCTIECENGNSTTSKSVLIGPETLVD